MNYVLLAKTLLEKKNLFICIVRRIGALSSCAIIHRAQVMDESQVLQPMRSIRGRFDLRDYVRNGGISSWGSLS
jgi:hypothetical protein